MAWGEGVIRLHAGVHLLTLHQQTGQLLSAATFLTWQPENSRQLLAALRDAGHGRLLFLLASVLGRNFNQILGITAIVYWNVIKANHRKEHYFCNVFLFAKVSYLA